MKAWQLVLIALALWVAAGAVALASGPGGCPCDREWLAHEAEIVKLLREAADSDLGVTQRVSYAAALTRSADGLWEAARKARARWRTTNRESDFWRWEFFKETACSAEWAGRALLRSDKASYGRAQAYADESSLAKDLWLSAAADEESGR